MVAALLAGVAGLPSARAASYADSVKALGPGAYWPLESWTSYGGCGSSCSSPDVVGSSENAIRQGVTTIGQSGAILTAPSTDSVRLQPASPTDGHLVFNINPLINPDVLSLELWFKTASSYSGPGNLFTNGTVHAGGYVTLQIDSSGHLVGVAQYRDGLGFRADATVTGPVVTDNAWHHAVIVAGTGGVSLFADGAQAGTAGAPKPIFTWGEETPWIGSGEQANSSVGGGGFDGWVDELVAYDRPVTLTEERTSFAASGRTPPPLVLNDGPLSPQLIQAGSSASISAPVCNKTGKPVTCPTGEFWHAWNDFTIGGRGPGLNLSHSYSTNQAPVNGPLGYGFTFSYNMRVEDPGTDWVTVHEETNTELVFHLDSGVYVAPAYVQATLVKNMDGSWTFTRRGTTTFSFNSTGQLTRIEDPNGYHTDLAYSSGRLATVTDSTSRALTFTWDTTNNRITEVSDPATTARTVEFSYNTDGTLSDYTDVAGGNWHFTYDTAHRMLTMRDPRHTSDGKVTENHYDNSGRVDWQDDELDRRTTFDYTTVPGSVITTDPSGNATLDEFADNVVISVTRGYGTAVAATWSYEYDADEATITEVTDPNSHTTSAEYDSAGNITSKTDGLANETTATFNSFNEPLTITDRNGVTTTYAYDSDGNLESVSTPLVGLMPAVARETTFDYADSSHPGDVTSMTDPRDKTWDYGYDSDGNRESVTDPLGNETTWEFNELGWPTAMVSARGNALGATPADYTTNYTYNDFGDVLTITDPLSNVTTRGYDAGRNLTSVEDANSNETTYVYDDAGQLVEIHRPDSSVLANEYWDDGLLKTQTDGASNDVGYVYDAQGRLVSSTDALGNTTVYGYDDGGNIVSREDPGGDCASMPKVLCTTFTYDAADQLATVTYSDGITPDITSVTYDDNGRRTALADSAGGSMAWSYDSLGALTASTVNSDTTSYEYDLAGNVTAITYPNSGGTIERGYDDAGRWTSVTDWASNTTTFDYDEDGHLTDTLYPGDVNEDIAAFDEAGRLTSNTFMADTTTLGSLTYSRDDIGLLTGETAVDVAGGSHTFGYNALDQLTTRDSTSTWTYDTADNLTTTGVGAAQTFNAGNQICYQTPSGSGSCGSPPAAATTFAFDQLGQRTSMAGTIAGRTGFGFDQAQRLTTVTRSHTRVAMGADFSVEIKGNGTVISAGNNSAGQLGDGTTTSSAAPVEVAGLTPGTIVSVAAGEDHALALLSDGTVAAWGDNSDGELGDNTTTSSSTPVAVSGLTGVVEISAGANFSLALKNDGTVYTWGDNGSGELGRGPGNYTSSTVPVQASGLTGVVDAAAGAFHAVAVKADGTVWTWGYGANGQLGNGVVANETVPQQVDGLNRVIAVAGGGVHTVALRADGTVYAWGDNDYGQLGDGTTTDAGTPVAVSGLTGVVAVDATNIATSALKADGTIYGWGTGNNNGTSASTVTTPAPITGTGTVTSLGTGPTAYHTLLASISGIVWAYGDNSAGQYAKNSTSQSATPQRTLIATPASVASGDGFSVHIRDDGTVVAAGANNVGQLGNNSTTDSSTPVTVSGLTAGTVVSVAAGEDHALAMKNDGTVIAWGNNSDGQLGDNSTTNSSVPVTVSGISKAIAVAAGVNWSLAVTRDGTVYTWGDNSGGQLGVGSWTDSHVPVQVSGLTNVVAAEAGGFHAVALKADGTVYTWGWGADGQLGNGSTSAQNAPVQVTAVSHITAVSAGGLHTLALRQDGTVYAWGGNPYGELGDGTTTSTSTPVRVANLSDVVAIAAHNVGSQAIRADGTGWGWGAGGSNGNTWSNTSTPVAMSDVAGLAALAHGGTSYHSLVTTQAGDEYAFGDNSTGAYGDGTTSSSPTAVDTGIDDHADRQPMTTVRHARYTYDADGQRRTKTTRAGTTTYQWDQSTGLELLLTEAGADNTIRYLYGPGGLPLEQIDDDDVIRYYHHDQLGSTRLLTDEAGVVIGNIGYDPYGTETVNAGPTETPLSYAGQYTDTETGLQYLRARYYDADSGQFLNRDPLMGMTRQAYAYGANSPLNFIDPTGTNFGPIPTSVDELGEAVSDVVTLAGDAVSITPAGQALSAVSQLTGLTLGPCLNGSLFGGYGVDLSLCYQAAPNGDSGFTITAGGGMGFPYGASASASFQVSNAQSLDDLGGWFSYGTAWGQPGEGPAFGVEGGIGANPCGDPVWVVGAGVGIVGTIPPVPFGYTGGRSFTWTF